MLRFSISLALFLAAVATLFIYTTKGLPDLSSEVIDALVSVLRFWFCIFLNLSILVALLRSVKFLFHRCIDHKSLQLLTCDKEKEEYIALIGYGDLTKVWRKFLFSIVWLSAVFMIIAALLSYLMSDYNSLFDWFDVKILYLFILFSGYGAIVLLPMRSKEVRFKRC
jgi:hypothetical protein